MKNGFLKIFKKCIKVLNLLLILCLFLSPMTVVPTFNAASSHGTETGYIPSLVINQNSTDLHAASQFTPKVKFGYDTDMLPLHDAIVFDPAANTDKNPDKNYHEADTTAPIDDKMTVQRNKTYGYYKFDISDFPEPDKIGKTVFSIWGRDTSKASGTTAVNHEQVFGAANTDWEETNITWNSRPQMDAAPITEILYQTANCYQDADITDYVKAQKARGAKYITLVVAAKEDGGVIFHRGRNTTASGQKPPRLTVSDPANVPEDLSLGADGRSRLYPEDWYPGFTDSKGRFLHDFSYAGYHQGEAAIPDVDISKSIDVTKARYNADNTGKTDTTPAIQAAIDAAGRAGGGVVYLPEGTYMVNPQAGKTYSLTMNSGNVVLKGAGMNKTFIYNATEKMKQKDIIKVGDGDWKKISISTELAADEKEPTVLIPVADASKFQVNDDIVISFETTKDFLNELGMQNKWASRLGTVEPLFYRKIVSVDKVHNTITIDVPTRYPLKQRDNVKITKTEQPISEVGLEDFSIANIQNSKQGLLEDDYKIAGTAAYDCDNSKAIHLVAVADSWIRNVNTYKPEGNSTYHILSKGIILDETKNVTIDSCDFRYPQYRGANGNGYLYQLVGNDNLIENSKAFAARHSFTYANFSSNGNVLYNNYSANSSLVTDFHMYLSMANLIDKHTVDGDCISALTRDYGSSTTNRHGVVTTESVFWNTTGVKAYAGKSWIIESEQFGNGYIIGTQGPVTAVKVDITSSIPDTNTRPYDMAEAVGEGARLTPQSLYLDQLQRRLEGKALGLKALYVNNEAVSGMQFLKTKYNYNLPFGTAQVPVISSEALSTDATVTITQPTSLNGTGTVRVTKNGVSKDFTIQVKPTLDKSSAISAFGRDTINSVLQLIRFIINKL